MSNWAYNKKYLNSDRNSVIDHHIVDNKTHPDDFEFKGLKEQVRKQIGMAVPPNGAKIIFDAILKTFASIEYAFIKASYQKKEF